MLASLQLASLSTTVVDFIARHGLLAVFGLMLVDALLPVGGELTMLYGGVLAAGVVAGADLSLFGLHPHDGLQAYLAVVAAGTLGYLLGSLAGWLIGHRGGEPLLERHGRWLHLGPERMEKARAWFHRFGARAVFLGRLTPLVRSFISVPAGVLRAPLPSYTLLTSLGSLIWCAAFAGAGWAVSGNWETVHHAFRYADYAVVVALLGVAAYVVARARRARRTEPAGAGR
ncbi:DedA family protein [Conexibacter sp. JD483]|uniref:DedA family protein n=1 Tax=unclassified Conexibacter TaxID=2627773 RepID=UPI00271F8FCC|nr:MULTISPECIES: DedA family protein [unclassified Conexibacter]MDO8186071.1 DedA family protein [Conexibacter sp. CPCC 205706]MDO8199561.1 DedA family protein [Conexibacter sp. CPCC 205762]MDR9372417.1 DedA family protein [Conexibacter sp. JD483]